MGIPRLRHHLCSFSDTVLLQRKNGSSPEGHTCIQSVVIDGPSLVYNVYSRLLSWFSESSNGLLDAVPTCNEVSSGVIIYLLQLRALGVKIERIYFDGALPTQKHETRLHRLENSRRKLELFCSRADRGFGEPRSRQDNRIIRPEYVLSSHTLPPRYSSIPDDPFIVPTVFEDLKYRWDKDNITRTAGNVLCLSSLDIEGFPWANVTLMVPGEADAHCVRTASYTGSSVLTNDSDLLLYDLGTHGSVVFLDSVERIGSVSSQPMKIQITAAMLSPKRIAHRLGIPSILALAYELKSHPAMGMAELVRRAKRSDKAEEEIGSYEEFSREYLVDWTDSITEEYMRLTKIFDARVSELFCQYKFPQLYLYGDCPHVYLAVLIEDCARQCVWAEGRLYRRIGYSILNISHAADKRFTYINEYVRQGPRITSHKILLGNKEWIKRQLQALQVRLKFIQAELGRDMAPAAFWRIFILCDLYDAETEFTDHEIGGLTRFLKTGFMGRRMEMADLHLTAQIHSIFYSLRILRQLLMIIHDSDASARSITSILNTLPPLHVMMEPVCEDTKKCIAGVPASEFAVALHHVLNHGQFNCAGTLGTASKQECTSTTASLAVNNQQENDMVLRGGSENIYELLLEQ